MKDKEKICGTCKWYVQDGLIKKYFCSNWDGASYADFTNYNDTCDEWEER